MKLFVWGIGQEARNIIESGLLSLDNVKAFIDSYSNAQIFMGKSVYRPEDSKIMEELPILVTLTRDRDKLAVWQRALDLGLSERLVFLYNRIAVDDVQDIHEQDDTIIDDISPLLRKRADRANCMKSRMVITNNCGKDRIDKSGVIGHEILPGDRDYFLDYTRFRTFELVADDIEAYSVPGSTAELGVFTGFFSRLIHARFPECTHYMYDTFTSFDKEEFKSEVEKGNIGGDFIDIFKKTSIDVAMKGMPSPDKCIIRQGLFPYSLEESDKDEKFCFVSLDVDLEESTYQGLQFFYPRLSPGGYIFLHDYNNAGLFGVRNAVRRYFGEMGQRCHGVPLCDEGGTLIISK